VGEASNGGGSAGWLRPAPLGGGGEHVGAEAPLQLGAVPQLDPQLAGRNRRPAAEAARCGDDALVQAQVGQHVGQLGHDVLADPGPPRLGLDDGDVLGEGVAAPGDDVELVGVARPALHHPVGLRVVAVPGEVRLDHRLQRCAPPGADRAWCGHASTLGRTGDNLSRPDVGRGPTGRPGRRWARVGHGFCPDDGA